MLDRRKYHREWWQRRRDAKLDAARQSRSTCPKQHGRGVCAGALYSITDGNGRSRVVCDRCERQRRGICRDCPLPVEGHVGKALRCAKHKREAQRLNLRRYAVNHRREVCQRAKASYRNDPAKRAARNEYKRLWRKLNRDKVKAQKRRANLRGYGKEYQAKRREREREQLAARERMRHHGITELRTCLTPGCDRVVTHRKKKCSVCKEREAQQAAALLASRRHGRERAA